MSDTISDPKVLFETLEARAAECKANLEQGENINLSGFQDQVQQLCKLIVALPKDEHPPYVARLENLQSTLKNLAQEIQNIKEKAAQEIKGVQVGKKAQAVYMQTDQYGGKPISSLGTKITKKDE